MSENIGACARAIKNFSFKKLILINPKPIFPNDKIFATSVGAKNIIHQSKVYENTEKALKELVLEHKVIKKATLNSDIKRFIYVPKRIVNLVI